MIVLQAMNGIILHLEKILNNYSVFKNMKYLIKAHNQRILDLRQSIIDNQKKAHSLYDENKVTTETLKDIPGIIFPIDIERAKKKILVAELMKQGLSEKDIRNRCGQSVRHIMQRYQRIANKYGMTKMVQMVKDNNQSLLDGYIEY